MAIPVSLLCRTKSHTAVHGGDKVCIEEVEGEAATVDLTVPARRARSQERHQTG